MTLGFTKSKVDSSLGFKVEGGRPVMLLLYANGLCMTEKRNSLKLQRRRLAAEFEMKDLDMMHYFLGMEVWNNLHGTKEVCSRDPKEVHDDGLQGHDHIYGIEPEAIECCFIIVG